MKAKNTREKVVPVILAGGSGTRLWPRSREKAPKQFIPLFEGKSLFQITCLRYVKKNLFTNLVIVTHEEHRFIVRDQLQDIGIKTYTLITEPLAKNTFPACSITSLVVKKIYGDIPCLFIPSDHMISQHEQFVKKVKDTLLLVKQGYIAIFGITPSSPHTGYGYIQKGKEIGKGIYIPLLFVEKPDHKKAEDLLKEGALWNSGLYLSMPSTLIKEAKLYAKEHLATLEKVFKNTVKKQEGSITFFSFPKKEYSSITNLSLDTTITEKSKRIIVTPTTIRWSDLGSWGAMHAHQEKDTAGNVIFGDSTLVEVSNSYVESSHRLVTVFGLDNIGVIETKDAVLVFPVTKSEGIKKVVQELSKTNREELLLHTLVHKPWGHYEVLDDKNPLFKAKKLTVHPGSSLSLQRHKKRAEHWVVVEGIATVRKGEEIFELRPNESTFIPNNTIHKLENRHTLPLSIIEIQTGTYFGEDDIERLEDTYGRL